MRPTWCEVDLEAISHNVMVLRRLIPNADFCAVVKADGYGHGAIRVAETAIDSGATCLAVALAEEGQALRMSGVDVPILLLSEPPHSSMTAVLASGLTPSLYTYAGIESAAAAAASEGRVLDVEICADTGMRRVGCEPSDVPTLVDRIIGHASLRLVGIWSHCAVADEPENVFTAIQVARLDELELELTNRIPALGVIRSHIGNSAVILAHASAVRDLVRCGIAMYGIDPSPELGGMADLWPALRLRSEVSFVKSIKAGEGVGYGHRWVAPSDRMLATVPIGYADGVRRDLGLCGGEVLIGGVRRPIVGVVTMDQLIVDLGEDATVEVGDEVVLIGSQGDDQITAAEIAKLLDTIPYEVLCAIGTRVPRHYD